jgi:hypothetical protein
MLPLFIKHRVARYNIAEMAIVFSLLSVALLLVTAAVGSLLSLVSIPRDIIGFICLAAWLVLTVWFWISFVSIGRQSPERRTSVADLTAMQTICAVLVAVHWVFAPAGDKDLWAGIARMFECIILGFHAVYFSMAWAMRAPVPMKTYSLFAVLVALVWLHNV